MLNKLAIILQDKLLHDGLIKPSDKDLYIYGIFVFLSHLLYLVIVLYLGVLFSCIFESFIFYTMFRAIRVFAGGYHARTETCCEILSILSLVICIIVIKFAQIYDIDILLLTLSILAVVVIFLICPLDTPEKPLTNIELRHFRRISLLVLLINFAFIAISYIFELKHLFAPSCLSLILESVLISAGKIKQLHSKKHAEQ